MEVTYRQLVLINVLSSDTSSSIDNLGIGSICSYLRSKNMPVTLAYLKPNMINDTYISEKLKDFDAYGLTFYANNAKYVFQAAELIKKHNSCATVFLGGYLASDAPKEILYDCSYIDYIVLGAGEKIVYQMMQFLQNGNKERIHSMASVVTRDDISEKIKAPINVCEMPFPARDNLTYSLKNGEQIARIYTARGCCGHCSFCSVNQMYKKWQGRPPKDILNEINQIHEKYKVNSFMFVDSSFEDPGRLGKERISELCKLLKKTICNILSAVLCELKHSVLMT